MPRIHTFTIPIFLDPIPYDIPRPVEILRRPGMTSASVLFHARQFEPMVIRTISTAPDISQARARAESYLRLVRKRVRVDDGIIYADQTVVLAVRSTFQDSGLIVGGSASGDRYEIATSWTLLLDADQDVR